MSLMTNLFTPLLTPRLMTFEIDWFSRILAGLAIDSSEQSKFPWNPWNLSFCHVLIHEKTPFLLKEGSRYYQIWIGRELSYSYLVKCTFFSYQKFVFFSFSWNKMWPNYKFAWNSCITQHKHMNYMKLVIPLHSLYWSIHTKDESKRGTAFAFIFGVNWPVQWM